MMVFATTVLYAVIAMTAALASSQSIRKQPQALTVSAILFLIIALIVSFFIHPSLSFSEYPLYVTVAIFAGMGIFIGLAVEQSQNSHRAFSSAQSKAISPVTLYGASLTILLLVYIVSSSTLFNAEEFRERLALTETEVFDASETLIDAQQGRYIDQRLAYKTAQTLLSKR
jgi:peptidoglycan/LPS O-acetylase OafA/YrhL